MKPYGVFLIPFLHIPDAILVLHLGYSGIIFTMNKTSKIVIWISISASVLGTCCIGGSLILSMILPKSIDSVTVSGPVFSIRATAIRELDLGMNAPGVIYEYEMQETSSGDWSSITRFRYSNPNKIPRGQIRFIDDQRAYIFHEYIFAVTVDGGATWQIHGEPKMSFDTLHQWNFPRITNVVITSDGRGTMTVEPYQWQNLSTRTLTTTDFGLLWNESQNN